MILGRFTVEQALTYSPETHDFVHHSDGTVTVIRLEWWDEASYQAFQGGADPEGNENKISPSDDPLVRCDDSSVATTEHIHDDSTSQGSSHSMMSAWRAKSNQIIDSQRRAMTLEWSNHSDWSVPVQAFNSDEVGLPGDRFLRVNNTRPLPRGLFTELLPEVSTPLPRNLAQK